MFFTRNIAPLALFLMTASFAVNVQAQDATDDQTTSDANETADDTVDLGTILLTTSRSTGTALDYPGNVTVIGEVQLENRDVNDLEDLVRNEPGVDISRQTSSTDPFNTIGGVTIRGVGGNRVGLIVDGSRVAERITDGTRDYFDFSFVKKAEIARGPASVLWGSDALGGVLALETLDPEDVLQGRNMGGSAQLSFDSLNDRGTAEISFAQQLSPELAFFLGYKREESNEVEKTNARDDGGFYGCPRNIAFGATTCGALDPTDITSDRVLAKLVWTPNTEHRLEFSVDYLSRDTRVRQNSDLGPVVSGFTGLPTGEVVNARNRQLDLSRQRFGVEHTWTPSGSWFTEVKTVLAFTPHSYESSGVRDTTSAVGDAIRTVDTLDYQEEFFELDVQATSEFSTGSVDHLLIFGFDGDFTTTDYQRISQETNLTTGAFSETRGGGFNFANADTTRADVYVQDTMSFAGGAFELTPGVRFANYEITPRPDADYQVVPGLEPRTRSSSEVLFSLAGTYFINDSWSLWAKFGQGFKMPTAQQLFQSLDRLPFFALIPNPNLRPESVDSYEIGARFQRPSGYFAINGFYSDYDDFIQNFVDVPGSPGQLTYANLSSVQIWGVEASGEWDVTSRTTVGFSASWQKGEQRASAGAAKTPTDLAPFTATVFVGHEIPQYNLFLEAVATVAGDVSRTTSPTGFKPDGYALLDLYAKWQVIENGSLNFGIQNVFDERYFTSGSIGRTTTPSAAVSRQNPLELYTGAGRAFQVSFDMEF